jgi:FKBP-type peptidyl-prolyl cis-trans isomerase 2
MADKVKNHDFIELDYTGKLTDGTVFDTTLESVAKENGIEAPNFKYAPAIVCVGEKQLLPGLDEALAGQEIGQSFTVNLLAEKAFGKRDVKNIKIVPMSTFKEHKLSPRPGLEVDVDGQRGVVRSIAGGRVIVNFNHHLSGKEVIYQVKVNRIIVDKSEQIKSFLNSTIRVPIEQIKVSINENKAKVELPMALPDSFSNSISKKLQDLTGLIEVRFMQKKAVEAKN